MAEYPHLKKIALFPDFTIYALFVDGSERFLDLTEYVKYRPQLSPLLADKSLYLKPQFISKSGIYWNDDGADLSEVELYTKGIEKKD